jgi:hypothetical protein
MHRDNCQPKHPATAPSWLRWIRITTFTALACTLLFPAARSFGGGAPSGLCPAGEIEQTNSGTSFDDVGCSLCLPAAGCEAECLTIPVQMCPAGPSQENTICCRANPCNGNCPVQNLPLCSFEVCVCEPSDCCSVVCPVTARAPAATSYGLIALVLALAATGMLYGRRRLQHR